MCFEVYKAKLMKTLTLKALVCNVQDQDSFASHLEASNELQKKKQQLVILLKTLTRAFAQTMTL